MLETSLTYPGVYPNLLLDQQIMDASINKTTGLIIGAAIKVHSELGPGLLESAYSFCLEHELNKSGLLVQKQLPLPVIYNNEKMDVGF